jgi:hypothetical protein
MDDQLKKEGEPLERSRKESRAEESREKERHPEEVPEAGQDEPGGSGHRISGSGTSTGDYPYRDRGEEGGASHPKPREG